MNNDNVNSNSNERHQGGRTLPPIRTPSPRFDPAKLPLVEIFRLIGKLNRRGELYVSEALAIHKVARRLGVMADFVTSGIKGDCHETDFDELYRAHKARCALKGDQPLSRGKFVQMLLLDPLKPKSDQPQTGE